MLSRLQITFPHTLPPAPPLQVMLTQPSMRSETAALALLTPLLRPFLAVLSPEGALQPSLATKEVLYGWVIGMKGGELHAHS
jgi:hypothetical protein